jgi:uncharacterized protein
MVPQERDLITTLLARLKSAGGEPKDPEADALIRQAMVEQPDAPYYLVQTVLIQDLSLHQAQNRIAELEKQLADAQAAASKPTSFLGGLFGTSQPASPPPTSVPSAGPWSRSPQVAAPPPPQGYAQPGYAPQQQGYAPAGGAMGGGMMGSMGMGGGGSFLRSAAATAAGVAGGALLFQGISSLFGHGYASGLYGGGMGMTPGLGETVINNYYGDSGSGAAAGGDYGGGSDAGNAGGGDYGGGGDYSGGDAGGGDYGGGGDYSGGGDSGGDFGGGDSSSC